MTTTPIKMKTYIEDMMLHDLVDLAERSVNYIAMYIEMYIEICRDIRKYEGAYVYLEGTVDHLESEVNDWIDEICNPAFENIEEEVSNIQTLVELPKWMIDPKRIVDAKRDFEDGHSCPECAGSGEGRWDGSTCMNCKGNGMITFKGIFEGEV